MRLLFTTVLGLSLLSLSSCKKVEDALNLTADVSLTPKSLEFVIPITSTSDTSKTLREIEVNMNVDSLIKLKDPSYDKSKIKGIKIKGFKLEIVNSDDANNLANFSSIHSQISANGKTPLVIVSKDNNPDVKASELLVPASESLDIKDYVTSTTFKYILKGKVRRATTKALTTKVTVDYNFTVSLK